MKNCNRNYSTVGLTRDQIQTLDNWASCAGILMPKVDNEGNVYFIMPMIYTWAIVAKADPMGYSHRFCYHTLRDCMSAYDKWEVSTKTEPTGYIKRKGRTMDDQEFETIVKWIMNL